MSADMLLIIDYAKAAYKDKDIQNMIKAVKHTQTTLRKHKKPIQQLQQMSATWTS